MCSQRSLPRRPLTGQELTVGVSRLVISKQKDEMKRKSNPNFGGTQLVRQELTQTEEVFMEEILPDPWDK
jgi:hypothetical protein